MAELTPDEAEGLAREWANHPKWTEECLQIRDKQGLTVPFISSPSNLRVTEAMRYQEDRGQPVRIVVLKARQVHNTAGCCTHLFKRVAFVPGQQCFAFGDKYESANNIWGYFDQFDRSYLPYLGKIRKPTTTKSIAPSRSSPGRLKWVNDSWIESNTAKNLTAGRSFSIRHLLLSEYAFYGDAATLMTGLLQAVPDDNGTTIIVESTANGVGGAFYDLWQRASDPRGGTDWLAVFFAWWEHPEYTRPLDIDRRRFEDSLSKEEQALWRNHKLALEQLNWRRWAIVNKCEGDTDRFHQEYPSTPEEAFLTSGRPRFDSVSLGRMPLIRDPLAGELERTTLGARDQILFLPHEDGKGALRVWKRPREGALYVLGADPAQGIDANEDTGGSADPDFAAAQVLDQDTGEQVACLHERLQPSEFGQYIVDVARWYNWAFIVPEAVGVGIALVEELLRQQYPLGLIYSRDRPADDRHSPSLQQLGFKTSQVSKPQLISALDRSIREASVIVRDPRTMQELRTFVYAKNGKQQAQTGSHDDLVIALALGVVGILHAPRDRRLRTDRPEPRHPDVPVTYGKRRNQSDRQYVRVRP